MDGWVIALQWTFEVFLAILLIAFGGSGLLMRVVYGWWQLMPLAFLVVGIILGYYLLTNIPFGIVPI